MRFRLCEFIVKDEFGFDRYCGAPAVFNRAAPGPYSYLCYKHHALVSGRMVHLYEHNEAIKNKVRRICPTCGKTFERKAGNVTPYIRSFCSMSCRAKFYAKRGESFTAEMLAAKRAKRQRDGQV